MSIPFLYPDNPISFADLPEQPLTVRLPAYGAVITEGRTQTLSRIVKSLMIHIIAAVFFVELLGTTALEHQSFAWKWVYRFEVVSIFTLAVAILIRPFVRSYLYVIPLIAIAHVTTVIVVVSAITGQGPTHGKALGFLLALQFMLIAMELGLHFYVLFQATSELSQNSLTVDDRPYRRLLIAAGIATFSITALANSTVPLAGVWMVVLATLAVAWVEAARRFKKPERALQYHMLQYFLYPIPPDLAPGLARSPAGHYFARTALIAIPVATFVCMVIAVFWHGQTLAAMGWLLLMPIFLLAASGLVVAFVAPATTPDQQATLWQQIVKACRESQNAVERNAIFLGYVAVDHSPVIVDRSLLFQHAHFLGTTGSGKTSLGLSPVIEQLVGFGDSTIIMIDLKGDTLEMFAAAVAAAQQYKSEHDVEIPIRVFSLENGVMSHAFNPFLTTGWTSLSILEKTDILCSSAGLAYGFDYGPSFFTSANSAVVTAANLANPDAMSFRQLYEDLNRLTDRNSNEIHPEFRRAGVHALEVIGRLASYEALNVTPKSAYTPEVLRNQIDLVDCYQRPQILYFKLPSSVSSIGSPSVAKLILYYLLIAGKSTARRVKVHVVIDEFQRMATESLDHMLQLARSLDVSLILANQSLNDLKVGSSKIYSAVATNCAIRQWFSVNSVEDLAMVEKLMGTRDRVEVSETHSSNGTSYTYRTEQVPRATVTDLHTISEDPRLSILQISGSGRGYARYNGIPFVCQSEYHITKKEYDKRRQMPWPTTLPGMMLTKESLDWRDSLGSGPKPRGLKEKPSTESDGEPNTWNPNLFES